MNPASGAPEPPIGDPYRSTVIAHAGRTILGPISAARLAALVERCALEPDDHVLEVGCGKGAFLVALLARWPGVTAEGFDRNPWFLADARAAAAAAGGDVPHRVSWVETDAPGFRIADRAAALTVAMGATGAFEGDQAGTLGALAGATRPGGTVLLAEGLWLREPPTEGLASFGMDRAELADGVEGLAALGRDAGLEPIDIEVVDDTEWDAYEGEYAAALERWAAAHPGDPDAAAFRARAALMADSYAAWRRGTFGYAIARYRVPAVAG